MGVLGAILGVGTKIFSGNPLGMQRLPIYAFSDIFSPDLTCHVVAFGKGIAISHRQKFGQLWGPQLPYQKSQENSAAGRHPLGPSATTWKNRNHSAM